MIFIDAENIAERSPRPSQAVIQEETRQQLEALKDLRRCLLRDIRPRAVGLIRTQA